MTYDQDIQCLNLPSLSVPAQPRIVLQDANITAFQPTACPSWHLRLQDGLVLIADTEFPVDEVGLALDGLSRAPNQVIMQQEQSIKVVAPLSDTVQEKNRERISNIEKIGDQFLKSRYLAQLMGWDHSQFHSQVVEIPEPKRGSIQKFGDSTKGSGRVLIGRPAAPHFQQLDFGRRDTSLARSPRRMRPVPLGGCDTQEHQVLAQVCLVYHSELPLLGFRGPRTLPGWRTSAGPAQCIPQGCVANVAASQWRRKREVHGHVSPRQSHA